MRIFVNSSKNVKNNEKNMERDNKLFYMFYSSTSFNLVFNIINYEVKAFFR
jgi:hypothetical protein